MPPRLITLLASRWTRWIALAIVVLIGALTRAPGFSSGQPWFDDAWVVLPAREPLSTAIHMVDTTPLFTLTMRSWILINPHSLMWDQSPIFVLGLVSIVAVYLLLRFFKVSELLALLGALVIAVSPVAVTYSTRIKQYNLDIIFACLVLWLFERWRRSPDRRGALAVAGVSSIALLSSASSMVIVAPVCLVALHGAVVERRRRVDAAVLIGVVGTVFVAEYLIWLRHLSHGLHVGWTNRGYMLTFTTFRKFAFSLENMGSEFFHWMIAMPAGHPPDPSKQITAAGMLVSAGTVLVLAAVSLPVLWRAARNFRTVAGPRTAAAIAIWFAVFLALAGVSPFGGGRTDEVLYPAVLLLLLGALSEVVPRRAVPTRAVVILGVAVAATLVVVGATNPAAYPTTKLTALYAKLEPRVTSHQYIVVDPWLTFGWGVGGYTKTSVSFSHSFFDWSQGFHVVSDDPQVVISDQYFFPQYIWRYLHQTHHELWYVGMTAGASWPTPSAQDPLVSTRNYHALRLLGWVPTSTTLRTDHTIAILMRYDARQDLSLIPPKK